MKFRQTFHHIFRFPAQIYLQQKNILKRSILRITERIAQLKQPLEKTIFGAERICRDTRCVLKICYITLVQILIVIKVLSKASPHSPLNVNKSGFVIY